MSNVNDRALLQLALHSDLTAFFHRAFLTVAPAQSYHHNLAHRGDGLASPTMRPVPSGAC